MSQHIISLIGNPNCGKTTLFNALTGSRQRVGNWPGVTVDKKTGNFSFEGHDIEVVDLPGIYSVTPTSVSGEDEIVARDYLLSGQAQVVVNIVDASNLERNLYLTSQLIEMHVPMIVVVNMLDIAKQHKIKLDLDALEKQLGCPVIGLVANRNKGIEDLKKALVKFLDAPVTTRVTVQYDEVIEKAADLISAQLGLKENGRWFAIQFLEHAPGIEDKFEGINLEKVHHVVQETDQHFEGNTDIEITNARYELVSQIAEKVVIREGDITGTLTDRIDRIILNRWMGLPIFLLIMYLTFLFTQNFGAVFIDFFDILVGGIFVDGLGVGDVGAVVLKDRKHLSEDGLLIVVMGVDHEERAVVSGPDIISRGFVYMREADELVEGARAAAKRAIDAFGAVDTTDWNHLKNNVRDAVQHYIYETLKRNPMILPIIVEI